MLSDEWADAERQEQTIHPGYVSAGLTFYKEKRRSVSGIHYKLETR